MTVSSAHGGNVCMLARQLGCQPEDLLDFSANINPLGPPTWLRPVVARALGMIGHYPEPRAASLRQAAAARLNIALDNVIAGNGSSELLYALPRVCWRRGLRRAVLPAPCYGDYHRVCALADLQVEDLLLDADHGFAMDWDALNGLTQEPALVILGQPGNPAGELHDPERIVVFAERHPQCIIAVDEAFADFVPDLMRLGATLRPNLFVLHSLTKFYAVPGLRLGLGYGSAELCAEVATEMPDWSVNGLAQAVGEAALQDEEYARATIAAMPGLREGLRQGLAELGLYVFPGSANYLLCHSHGLDASGLQRRLLEQRIMIRACAEYRGLDGRYFRVAVRGHDDNVRLLEALRDVITVGGWQSAGLYAASTHLAAVGQNYDGQH